MDSNMPKHDDCEFYFIFLFSTHDYYNLLMDGL
jgi:hypothetical protein